MPKKTVSETDGEKPQEIKKKRTTRKTKAASKEGLDSIKPAPVVAEPVEDPKVPPVEEVIHSEPIRASGTMEDISKPKTKFAQRVAGDTNFLAAENYSFGLRDKKPRRDNSWIKKTVYVLGSLILVMTIALVGMTYYSSRQLDETETSQNETQNNPPANQQLKFGIANAEGEIKSVLSSLVRNKFPDLIFNDAPAGTLPVVEADTLFIKPSAKSQADTLLLFLADYGIKPQIQENETMQEDIILYLVAELKNPDLSGLTAAVYNASGVTGAAQRACDVLVRFRASSCNALNSPNPATGFIVQSTEQSTFFMLKRTSEFKTATFQPAAEGQVENVRVILGR